LNGLELSNLFAKTLELMVLVLYNEAAVAWERDRKNTDQTTHNTTKPINTEKETGEKSYWERSWDIT